MASLKRGKTPWTNTAFMIESLVLLFVLVASLAVFTALFAYSADSAKQAQRISDATAIAQNAAEEFSANPASAEAGKSVGAAASAQAEGFAVSYDVTAQPQAAGTFYSVHITVSDSQGEAYALDAARFVEGGE